MSIWAYPLRAGGVEWDATQTALVDVIWFAASSATMADYASRISQDRVIAFHPTSAQYYTWSQTTGTVTAPENANCMIIKVGHKSLGGDCVRPDCYFDDVTMSTVPDPATLGLMLLGGSSVLLRRK
ncbi:MAG: PEP-CTERM sorting domain-containing protein [Planctomycetes bacterium]|nr:PEP-CTERM sorting domain-containing protein [Planctomycetota bacterium]